MTTRRGPQRRQTNVPRTREERDFRERAAELAEQQEQLRRQQARADALQEDIEAVRPFMNGDGEVDLLAALENVDRERLTRLFGAETVQRVERVRNGQTQARVEAQPQPVEQPAEPTPTPPAEPSPRAAIPEPPTTLDANVVNSLRREPGQAQQNILRGVSEGQDLDNAVRLANQRAAESLREFGFDVAGLRSRYEVQDRQLQARVERFQQRVSRAQRGLDQDGRFRWPEGPERDYHVRLNQERLEQFRERLAENRQAQQDFDQYVRALRPVIQETINESLQAVPGIVSGTGGRPGIPSPEASQRVPVSFDDIPGGPDIPGARAALERAGIDVVDVGDFPEGTRFQITDPDTGESRGFAVGQEGVDVARGQGFGVQPVRIITPEQQALGQQPERRPLTGRFPAPEEDFGGGVDAPQVQEQLRRRAEAVQQVQEQGVAINRLPDGTIEVDLVAALEAGQEEEMLALGFTPRQLAEAEQQRRAFQALVGQGFATDVGGNVDVVGAANAGLQPLLIQAGFNQGQITQAREEQFQAEVRGERFLRQVRDPGTQDAMIQLQSLGLADERGVNTIGAVEQGLQGVLLQAGFTQSQVREAEQSLADIRLAEAGGQPGGVDASGLAVSRAFPTGQPVTTTLATDEALEAAAQRQREIDQELMGLRGLLRQSDEAIGGPNARAEAERRFNQLIQEKTEFEQAARERLGDLFERLDNISLPEFLRAEAVGSTTVGQAITRAAEQPPAQALLGSTTTGAIPSPGPTGAITAGVVALAVGAQVLRENPDLLQSTQRQQVTPGDVSPPAFPLTRPDLDLPGISLQRPGELADIPPARVEPPTLPGGPARAIPPEVVTTLNMAVDVVEREEAIRRDFGDFGIPESVSDFLDRPTAAEPTVAVPIEELIERALRDVGSDDETRSSLRSRLTELERRRRALAQAQAELVASGGFDPQNFNDPQTLAAATAAAFQMGRDAGGTTPERGPGRPTLPTRETAPPGRPERPDVRDDPQALPDAVGTTLDGLDLEAQRSTQLQQQLAASPDASTRQQLINSLQSQLSLSNALQSQLVNQPELANQASLANQLSQSLQNQLALQQRLALNPELANSRALRNQLAQQTATQAALRTQLRTATRTRTQTRTATRTATRALTRPLTATRTLTTTAAPPLAPPPGLPDLDSLERDSEGRLNVKEITFDRGILDTKVNLVTGQSKSAKDIEGVPEVGMKRSLKPVSFSDEIPGITREHMGFHDAVFDERGSLIGWIDKGKPLTDAEVRRMREEAALKERQPRQRNPLRSRGIGRRRGGL